MSHVITYFFACPYSLTIWMDVVDDLLGTPANPDWDVTLNRLTTYSYNRDTFLLLRLVFQVSIYYIWRERNERRHNRIGHPTDHLIRIHRQNSPE